MKHVVKPTCRHKCRFLQISDELWLCPHASYGRLSYMKGAVEDARALMERHGGYDGLLAIITAEELRKQLDRDTARGKHPEPEVQYR